jgi:hypothetical protein
MRNSDNSAATARDASNPAAHEPTGGTSSDRPVQDTSTSGTQQDMQVEAQQQWQQQQGRGQNHVNQQRPRPTHFVSLRVSHSPQVCWVAAAPAAICPCHTLG